jgi:hypothetical protein
MSATVALLLLALAVPPDTLAPPRSAVPAPPDPLAQLVGALARLPATKPVRARVEHRVTFAQGDEEPPPAPGTATATASSGPEGLRITFSPSLLARAEAEERDRLQNPDAPTPTRDAVGDLRTLALARSLDAVPEMLRSLHDARVLEDKVEPFEGAPTRVLLLQVKPAIASRDRKYVKDIEATARVWLGADGVPIATDRRVLLKGRIFLVITFEIEQKERLRFGRSGDRLVVLRQESDFRSAGAGERRDRFAVTTLSLLE